MKQKNSTKLFLICLLLSLLLHMLAAIQFSPKINELQPPPATQSQNNSNGNGSKEDEKTYIWVSAGIIPCDTYEGIGIQFNSITGIVNYVASGSPADKAGLEIGDELITPLWGMDLMFGQKIQIIVSRHGKRLTMPVVVDRICQQ